MIKLWAVRLTGWEDPKLVPEGRLEAYILSLTLDKKSETTVFISRQEIYND